MFERLKNRWKETRGLILKEEFLDAALRLNSIPEEVNVRAADTFATSYEYICKESGPINNISNAGKIEISKMLNEKARKAFKMDMGRAYGLFLLGMHYESSSLPGDDAKFVHKKTTEILASAITISREIDEKIESKNV